MLYHIFDENENAFEESLKKIMLFYFPQSTYETYFLNIQESVDNYDLKLKDWITDVVNKSELSNKNYQNYQLYNYENKTWMEQKFPFLDRFHYYFLQRAWNDRNQEGFVKGNAKELTNLYKSSQSTNNYSKNYKNYNHFINVVAALVRLIQFFSKTSNIKQIFHDSIDDDENKNSNFYSNLSYEPPNFVLLD